MPDKTQPREESEFSAAPCSAFVVQDLTGEVPVQVCHSKEAATKWVAHLMEWRPNARPVVSSGEEIIEEALKAGMQCAENCRLNATYHKRVIGAALALFRPNDKVSDCPPNS